MITSSYTNKIKKKKSKNFDLFNKSQKNQKTITYVYARLLFNKYWPIKLCLKSCHSYKNKKRLSAEDLARRDIKKLQRIFIITKRYSMDLYEIARVLKVSKKTVLRRKKLWKELGLCKIINRRRINHKYLNEVSCFKFINKTRVPLKISPLKGNIFIKKEHKKMNFDYKKPIWENTEYIKKNKIRIMPYNLNENKYQDEIPIYKRPTEEQEELNSILNKAILDLENTIGKINHKEKLKNQPSLLFSNINFKFKKKSRSKGENIWFDRGIEIYDFGNHKYSNW